MSIGQILLIILSGLGIFHGLFIAILLWSTHRARNISNKLLSLLMLVLSLRVGKSVIMVFTGNLPILYIYLGLCLMLFIGPLFLLYSKALINRSQRINLKELFHFVPAVLFIMMSVPMERIGFLNIPDAIAGILYLIFYLHFLCYVVFVKQKVIPGAGNLSEIKTWLNIIFFGLLAIWFEYMLNLFDEQIPYILGPIVYSITVYSITFLAFKHKYLTLVNAVKYQTSGFNETETVTLFESIEKLMQNETLFLDPNLSLIALGKRLKVNTQKLSMVINSQSGSNFNDYVNKYRVDYAQEILKNPIHSNLNIAAIAYDCGFNSLSSFNNAFKKYTAKTPSAYKKEMFNTNI